jgi:hypothetical protein
MLLFGRLNSRVVLDEVYPDSATRKRITVVAAMAGAGAPPSWDDLLDPAHFSRVEPDLDAIRVFR